MSKWKFFVPAIAAAAFTLGAASPATAQVSFGVQVGGPPPVCPYGYYDFAPYNCAPYGYYGPEWFNNGAFIGAGPWWHGDRDFHGHVDRRFDPHYGYHGPYPHRGERFDNRHDFHDFHGRDMRGGYGGHDNHGGGHDDHDHH